MDALAYKKKKKDFLSSYILIIHLRIYFPPSKLSIYNDKYIDSNDCKGVLINISIYIVHTFADIYI